KAAELCMVGLTAGAAQGALTNLVARKKKGSLLTIVWCSVTYSDIIGWSDYL
ncbi:hypothetical protein Tco_0562996, partial [Tanacetum coccineum]